MSLLDFARGPGLQWSLVIFVVGVLWRLLGVLLLRTRKDLSEPRRACSLERTQVDRRCGPGRARSSWAALRSAR